MITLYPMPSSGNSYKVRFLFTQLGITCTHIATELGDGQDLTRTPAIWRSSLTVCLPNITVLPSFFHFVSLIGLYLEDQPLAGREIMQPADNPHIAARKLVRTNRARAFFQMSLVAAVVLAATLGVGLSGWTAAIAV